MPQKAKSKVICEASISVIRSYDRTKDIDAHTHFTPPYFMRRLAAAEAAALPVISRAIEGQVFHLRKSSTSCPAIIISPYETRTLFPHFGKSILHTSKNRPACADTHIGPEGNYLKCSSTRLKCSFGLLGALFFNHLQRPQNRPFRGHKKEHSIPLAILRSGLIRAKINDVRGDNWEGRCSAARMPNKGKARSNLRGM